MPKAQGVWRTEWRRCDRCGFLTPITHLQRQQGMILCTYRCLDDLSINYRPKVIQLVLQQPGEGMSEQSERFKDPGEIVEF